MAESLKNLFPAGLKGIVFDCDGVMIDSEDANRFLYNTILTALGLPRLTVKQERLAFQATFRDALDALVPERLRGKVDAICNERLVYDRDVLPRIKIMPGYVDFLRQARAEGLRMAIDTNRTTGGVHRVLDFLGLPPYFDPVVSCEAVSPKPSPEGAEHICRQWNISPGQALFVGDSPDDRAAAKACGMVFAGFGGLRGDVSVADWAWLAALLWPEK